MRQIESISTAIFDSIYDVRYLTYKSTLLEPIQMNIVRLYILFVLYNISFKYVIILDIHWLVHWA